MQLSAFFFFKNVLVLAMIFSRFKWLMIWNIQTLANCDTVNAFQKLRVNKSNEMTCWSSCFNLKISLLSLCTTMTFRIARRLARQTKSPVVTSFLVIWRDTKLLICPFRSIRPREVTQNRIRVMPAVPKDPEPHDTTDKLRLKLLLLRQLRVLSVLWLNVRSATRLSACYSRGFAS